MRFKRALLALGTVAAVTGVASVPAAQAAYPFKCKDHKVLLVNHTTGAVNDSFTSIQPAVDAAMGDPLAGGDTVIVCHGTFNENVTVAGATKQNVTVRSGDDTNQAKVVGTGTGPVFTITAAGVVLGGPGLGLTISGPTNHVGVQVGTPAPIDLNDDDDQPLANCVGGPDPTQCPDKEEDAFTTTNVTIVGNRITGLSNPSGDVTGIAVNNTNNTLTYRNLVSGITAGGSGTAYGIRYSDTNYNADVNQNAVQRLTQTAGGTCTNTDGGADPTVNPAAAAIGVDIEDETLDALVNDTLITDVKGPCGIGVYSNAWGGLENDRNGQQVPIATDLTGNRIKNIGGTQSDGVVLAPIKPDTKDDESPPSSFRLLDNDIDVTKVAVSVRKELAPNSYIRENDLDGDGIGVENSSTTPLDATNNWWGCQEGPASGKKGCATIVNSGTGSTTSFAPWLKDHVDHAGEHAGEWAGHG